MKANLIRVLAAVLLTVCLCGCWNSRELNSLSIVAGIGLDKVPGKNDYRVTFQVVVPSATSTSKGGGSGQLAVTVYSANDESLFGALRKASKKATRQLFFAHTQLLVIGESLAREGIGEAFDLFERSHELRLNTSVLLSRDTDAASVMKILLPLENIPSIGMVRKSENTAKVWGETQNSRVNELINGLSSGGDIAISGIGITGSKSKGGNKSNLEETEVPGTLTIQGMGLFKGNKLVRWVEGSEARGIQWVTNKIDETVQNVQSEETGEDITINVFETATRIKTELRKGTPVFHVSIYEEGNVIETKTVAALDEHKVMQNLEVQLTNRTKEEVTQAVHAAQEVKADVFHFGDELKRTDPAAWEQVKDNWPDTFAQGELDIQVRAYIRNTGMRLKPYKPEQH